MLAVLVLIFAALLLAMIAQQIRVAYPIFLVLTGLGISFLPGVPEVHLRPDIILVIFLPPMLYEAAWYTSWNDFWKWRRPILLMAFGLVFFTSSIVAVTTWALIPGFTLALGFLLGGIVSPPDAIAAATVLKGMSIPNRILAILEGESLVNDASSLIVCRFAVVAVMTGQFSLHDAAGQFIWVTVMGIVVGLAGGLFFYFVHRLLPTIPTIDAAITVLTPYFIYLAAERYHYSGIMAVVSCGLFMSSRAHEIFDSGQTRMYLFGVWSTLIFVMNTLVFVLIGLELPDVIESLGNYSIAQAISYGLAISGIVIAVRFLWVYPGAHLPRLLSSVARREPNPGWKEPLVISWAGMRGVVSLATALSIPLLATDGSAFPQRNLIIFVTYVVIFVTLVFQGLSLPIIVKVLHIRETQQLQAEEEQDAEIQLHLSEATLAFLDEKHASYINQNDFLKNWKMSLENDVLSKRERLSALDCPASECDDIGAYHRIMLSAYAHQRKELFRLKKKKLYSDEEIRKAEMQIDLNELKITGIER